MECKRLDRRNLLAAAAVALSGLCVRPALAQGKPDTILSRLGLDADGVVDEVMAWVRSNAGHAG